MEVFILLGLFLGALAGLSWIASAKPRHPLCCR